MHSLSKSLLYRLEMFHLFPVYSVTTSVVTLEALESALDTLLAVSAENDFEKIQVFGAFDTPMLHFNTHNKSYELRADAHRRLHAGPESRLQLLRNRFMSLDVRVKRNRLFAPPSAAVANTAEYMEVKLGQESSSFFFF